MHYDFIAIADADVPQAVEPIFQHVIQTYASEANKTVGVWRAVPDHLLDFKPHEKTNPIRTILVHQLLSERRFFAQFVGTEEPTVEDLLPSDAKPVVQAYAYFPHPCVRGKGKALWYHASAEWEWCQHLGQ